MRLEHRLKDEIYKRGYTLDSFSDLSGVSRFTLRNVFLGKKVRGDTVYLISNGLNVSYEEALDIVKG